MIATFRGGPLDGETHDADHLVERRRFDGQPARPGDVVHAHYRWCPDLDERDLDTGDLIRVYLWTGRPSPTTGDSR